MKPRSLMTAGICTALLAAAMTSSAQEEQRGLGSDSRVIRGFAMSPVPLSLGGKNLLLVGWGSYLVNAVGGCNDCHTHPSYLPGGDPFKGETPIINAEQYLTGGRQFGPFTSANITPDQDGRPAGLTSDEFKFTIRTGHDPRDPSRLLQVMPWPVYGNMTDLDLRAIYEFLSAIPSRPGNPNPGP